LFGIIGGRGGLRSGGLSAGSFLEAIQNGGEHPDADGFLQDVSRALEIGFLFPFPLFGAGINNQRTPGGAAAKFFENPNSLNAGKFDIDDARVGEAMREQWFRFIDGGAMNNPVLFRAEAGTKGLREFRVGCENQECLHFSSGVAWVK